MFFEVFGVVCAHCSFCIYLILKILYMSRLILEERYLCSRLKQQQLNRCFRSYIPIYLTLIMRDTLLRGIELCQLPSLLSTSIRFGNFVCIQILNTKFWCFLLWSLMHSSHFSLPKYLFFFKVDIYDLLFFSLTDGVLFSFFLLFNFFIFLW